MLYLWPNTTVQECHPQTGRILGFLCGYRGGSRRFLVQDTLPSLLNTDWFHERIRA